MGERDEDLERIREGLDQINEAISEVALTQAQHGTRLETVEQSVRQLATAINGSDTGKAGLKTRIAVLEDREHRREETKPVQPAVPSEIAQVETARAAAAKTRWEAVKAWGPMAAAGAMVAAKLVEWASAALGGKQ